MKILIISQPKCGTTALYSLIQQALPAGSRAWFEPTDLPALIAELDQNPEGDAVCKYLLLPWKQGFEPGLMELIARFDKLVLLYRDPRELMVSSYLYSFYDSITAENPIGMALTLQMLERKEAAPASLSFAMLIHLKNRLERGDQLPAELEFIPQYVAPYQERPLGPALPQEISAADSPSAIRDILEDDAHTQGFLSYVAASCQAMTQLKERLDRDHPDLHWLAYEDLVESKLDPTEEYLGLRLGLNTEVEGEYSRVTRTKGSGNWKVWVTESDREWLKACFGSYFSLFGYADDEALPACSGIDSKVGSDYVYKLFVERHERDLEITRQGLSDLGKWLWGETPARPRLLSGMASKKAEVIGSDAVAVTDAWIEDGEGNRVNLLLAGETYRYCYRVSFGAPFGGVDFWMQINSHRSHPYVNGSSIRGKSRMMQVREPGSYEVAFRFLCDMPSGLYYCNAGVTRHYGGKPESLHRRISAYAFVAYKATWLPPEVKRVLD